MSKVNWHKVILSLCDYSGVWPRYYRENDYDVRLIDLQYGQDVRLLEFPGKIHGILAAPLHFILLSWEPMAAIQGGYDCCSVRGGCLSAAGDCVLASMVGSGEPGGETDSLSWTANHAV